MGFTVQAACLSHIGNRRANNEDNFFSMICVWRSSIPARTTPCFGRAA